MMAIGADADIVPLKDAADALPAVWSDRAGFERAAGNLAEAARRMATAAATDNRPEFAKANLETVAACSTCHMAYRGARIKP
jgi:cytochrome c556